MFSRFASEWPDIRLSINFDEEPVDLMTEPYGIDFRAGPLPDSSLKARKAMHIEPGLYASPKLFEFHPIPWTPEDLRSVPCISFSRMGPVWTLEKGARRVAVPVKAVHSFGSVILCYEFAFAGHGIAMMRTQLARRHEESGELVRVLPDWTGPCHDMYIVTTGGQTPRRARLFMDYVAEYLSSLPG